MKNILARILSFIVYPVIYACSANEKFLLRSKIFAIKRPPQGFLPTTGEQLSADSAESDTDTERSYRRYMELSVERVRRSRFRPTSFINKQLITMRYRSTVTLTQILIIIIWYYFLVSYIFLHSIFCSIDYDCTNSTGGDLSAAASYSCR